MAANGGIADDVGFLLSRASGVVARSVNKALAPLGLRVRSYSVLLFACEWTPGITQRQLASVMGLDPSQIVALVDDLEQRDLVTRMPDPADRRNKLITATDEGYQLRDEALRRVEDAHASHFEHLSPAQLDDLRRMLHQIVFADE
ncbi:MarR family winged helix-turn-helix transcriptional regulator [Haloechinothrix salitolerans]|uniref:MarR family winged helix-turn-helix transcriptional regulator n=1 Tax=Haloechinothrix salitolerans TaxID=926830 RepID=A0ABW2C808_9PSEU